MNKDAALYKGIEFLKSKCGIPHCRKDLPREPRRKHPVTRMNICTSCYMHFKRHGRDKPCVPKRDCPILFGLLEDDDEKKPPISSQDTLNANLGTKIPKVEEPFSITVTKLPDVATLLRPKHRPSTEQVKSTAEIKIESYSMPNSLDSKCYSGYYGPPPDYYYPDWKQISRYSTHYPSNGPEYGYCHGWSSEVPYFPPEPQGYYTPNSSYYLQNYTMYQ